MEWGFIFKSTERQASLDNTFRLINVIKREISLFLPQFADDITRYHFFLNIFFRHKWVVSCRYHSLLHTVICAKEECIAMWETKTRTLLFNKKI